MKKFSVSFICIFIVFLIVFSISAEAIGTSETSPAGCKYMKTENLALNQNKNKMTDGNDKTVYRFSNKNGGDVIIDLGSETTFNNVIIKEKGLNVKEFVLSSSIDGEKYTEFYRNDKIEFHRFCNFEPVNARYIKFSILKSDTFPKIREFEVYNEMPEKNDDFRVSAYSTVGGSIYEIIDDESVSEGKKDSKIKELLHKDYFETVTDYIQIGNVSWNENGEISTVGWDKKERDEEKYHGRMMNNIHSILDDTHTNFIVTILNPTGENGNEKVMKSITENKDKLITNMISFANKYQIDGIDLDWEFPLSQQEFDAYNVFLQELKSRMTKEMWNGKEATLSIAVATWALKYTPETTKCIDFVNVMGYDILDQDGQHSSFFSSCVQAAKYLESQGFTKEQIVIGFPFYGTYVNRNMEQYLYKEVNYDEVTPYNNCYTMKHRETGEGRYSYFNSQAIIRDKTAYAYLNGYGGVMIFSLYCDLPANDEKSLIKAISSYLKEV